MARSLAIRQERRRIIPAWLWPAAGDLRVEYPTLVRTGLALVFIYLSFMFTPDPIYSVARFIIPPLALLWFGLALTKMTRRLRFAFPFYVLLLLQVWMVISMLYAQQFIEKPFVSGEYLWYPLENGMIYVITIGLCALMPSAIRYVINFLLVLCTISAGMAILQAFHVGPALRVADFYVYRSIEGWDNVSGVRASGLSSDPNTNLLVLLVGAGLIAYKSTKRSLTVVEWVIWAMFIIASFVAQHRSSMPIVGLTFLVTLAIMLRRRPLAMIGALGISAACFLLVLLVGRHTFAYTFETTWSPDTPQLTWRFRQEDKAAALFMKYPLTGVGPAPMPEAFGIRESEDDFKVENLYYSTAMTSGVPGLVLVLSAYFGALALCTVKAANKNLSNPQRVIALVGALAALDLIWNGNVKVNLATYHNMFAYMTLMAIVQLTLTQEPNARRRTRVSPYLQHRDQPGLLVRS